MPTDLILGTAGHIDHGKTALVKALTGIDTDRLPEEKRRGITIDLGFAELPLGPYRLGIVDVPGHERFVRNMLAGATGVDLALLVIAADESVKPQTREHLEILRLLRLRAGVIALTKCDLPERDWMDLVEEEVRAFVAGTFLAAAPIVRTSVVSGQGLDELRAALHRAAETVVPAGTQRTAGPFRMAVDRAFAVAGHGTVVTGSVASGQARVGDELTLEPGEAAVRVRGLENHGRAVEEVHRGQRAAINLAGIHHERVARGMELATPGHLRPSQRWSAQIGLLADAARPLRNRARVRIHVGAAELMARVALLDRDELQPGDDAPAQLFLSQPAVATWGQPLVVRSESPVATIGGGQTLDPDAPKLRRRDAAALARLGKLQGDDPLRRAGAALYFAGWRGWTPADLARTAGIADGEPLAGQLAAAGELVEFAISPTRTARIHRDVLDEVALRIEAALAKLHAQQPLAAAFERAQLTSRFARLAREAQAGEALLTTVLRRMAAAGRISASERGVALAGRGPKLSPQQADLLDKIIEVYRQAAFQPPSAEQVQSQFVKNLADVPRLIKLAVAEGRLVAISPEFCLHAEAERQMRETLDTKLAGGAGLTVSQIRELLGTTRKYAVPICEYLDRIGFTQRRGDLRVRA